MHKILTVLTLMLLIPVCSLAQSSNFTNTRTFWKRYRYEVCFGLGATNFLGDLGGMDRTGTDYSPIDLEVSLTRPAVNMAFRYRLSRRMAIKSGIYYGIVNGDDRLTKELYRNNRNLHFKSNIYEISTQIEFAFVLREQVGHRYKIKNVKGYKNIDMTVYWFAGAGAFYFNPKAKYEGTWYELQPLGTEGQGLKEGVRKYSRISAAIPMGIGFRHHIDRQWSFGLEYGFRKTFTDYIDDVSTVYYDNATILAERGEAAAYLADPSLGLIQLPDNIQVTGVGQQRGDPRQKDGYMFASLSVNYKFRKRKTKAKF